MNGLNIRRVIAIFLLSFSLSHSLVPFIKEVGWSVAQRQSSCLACARSWGSILKPHLPKKQVNSLYIYIIENNCFQIEDSNTAIA